MSEDAKKVKKVAQCIQTLLEMDGVSGVPISKIVEEIKEQDLSDANLLKDMVKVILSNDMRAPASNDGPSTRQQKIETFMVKNWDQLKSDETVRNALLDAYCKGRIKKDKRTEMQKELLNRCEKVGSDTSLDLSDAVEDQVDDNEALDF